VESSLIEPLLIKDISIRAKKKEWSTSNLRLFMILIIN
jgi:hypothetical protein